jgi:hypothetical protein
MYNIFIILLGCNIYQILNDRIETSIKFANNLDDKIDITWFISGGIKDKNKNNGLEADLMKEILIKNQTNYNWNYIMDIKSTNTAENLFRASKTLNDTMVIYRDIYIVTSEYHYERVKRMMEIIDSSKEYKWILSQKELQNSKNLERIFMNNILNDIQNAKIKILFSLM